MPQVGRNVQVLQFPYVLFGNFARPVGIKAPSNVVVVSLSQSKNVWLVFQ